MQIPGARAQMEFDNTEFGKYLRQGHRMFQSIEPLLGFGAGALGGYGLGRGRRFNRGMPRHRRESGDVPGPPVRRKGDVINY